MSDYLNWLVAIAGTCGVIVIVLITIAALLATIMFAVFVHDEVL